MKREGPTEASKLARQERVQRLYIRRVQPTEMARVEQVDIRTIQRDLKDIKSKLLQVVPIQQLRTPTLAMAEADEISRELWTLYHRAPREAQEDDRRIKIMILSHLAKVSDLKNRLIFQTPAQPVTQNGPQVGPQNPDQAVRAVFDSLPEPLRRSVREELERQQTGVSKENS